MNILQRLKRAISPSSGSSTPVVGGGTMGAGLDIGQVEALQREEFEADEHEDKEGD